MDVDQDHAMRQFLATPEGTDIHNQIKQLTNASHHLRAKGEEFGKIVDSAVEAIQLLEERNKASPSLSRGSIHRDNVRGSETFHLILYEVVEQMSRIFIHLMKPTLISIDDETKNTSPPPPPPQPSSDEPTVAH